MTAAASTPRRRSIVGAAWTAPLALAVASAPAAAASGSLPIIIYNNTTIRRFQVGQNLNVAPWFYQGFGGVQGNTSIQNVYQSDEPVVTSVRLVLTFSAGAPITTNAGDIAITGAGWVTQSVTVDGSGATVVVFEWAGSLSSSQSTPNLAFTIPSTDATIPDSDVPAFTVSWSASSPQASNTPTATTTLSP